MTTTFVALGAAMLVVGYLWILLVQRRYIEDRYRAAGLFQKRYFQSPLLSYLGDHTWMAFHCTLHLLLVRVLPNSTLRSLSGFRDLEGKEEVLRHFSRREVAMSVGSGAATVCGPVVILMSWIGQL